MATSLKTVHGQNESSVAATFLCAVTSCQVADMYQYVRCQHIYCWGNERSQLVISLGTAKSSVLLTASHTHARKQNSEKDELGSDVASLVCRAERAKAEY